ncbi:Transposon Ty3-I Gag-Pol polyprotein [Vitis vinifera]|uniref:Transposon Ty3-I Gag-Pol polyprotein n=1 Tax=Vitis vinifera TaxID=29760 RepID=A0A438JMR8_VITVI|nr:Transposon Ty3-I Gag-Pol polyprotein [Vitis vinifera]
MLAMSLSQIEETIKPGLALSFDLFGVSASGSSRRSDCPCLESVEDLITFDDLIDSHVGIVEGASDFVDPPLSFDVLSGFVSRSDIVSDIFDIDDEIAQHDSDDDSSPDSDSDPLIREFHLLEEEIQKQLSVGFLLMVEYPEWLANVVPVPKKDDMVRVCVDFRDLNKASPKDDFPLPHIDMLVDSTTGHSMLSFMDGFSGYSQILMAPKDMEKTSFITE